METSNIEGIIGNCPKIQESLSKLIEASENLEPVLISGEIGTGKKLFAQKIHEMSTFRDGPFWLYDDCIKPDNPFLTAFAVNISSADGGTLVFCDIDTLGKGLQENLLSHFSNQQFDANFGKTEVSFRVIATTTKSLEEMTSEDTVKERLYDWISDYQIVLPPLRERLTDIEAIVNYYLKILSSDQFPKGYSPEFIQALENYEWPRNIKELIEALEVSVRNSGNENRLEPDNLPLNIYQPPKEPIILPEDLSAKLENCDTNRTFENKLFKDTHERKNEKRLSKPEDAKLTLCFYQNGDYWSIGKIGKEKNISNMLGLTIIHYLLTKPNEHIDCLRLHSIANKSSIITDENNEKTFEYDRLEITNTIDSDIDYNVIATTKKKDIESAIKLLESQIEEMKETETNIEKLEIKKNELKGLKGCFKAIVRPGHNPQRKRAQENVQKLIKRGRNKILTNLSYMETHLRNITTGYWCIYNAKVENEPEWVLYKNLRDRRNREI
jgi:hypothetical protein